MSLDVMSMGARKTRDLMAIVHVLEQSGFMHNSACMKVQ